MYGEFGGFDSYDPDIDYDHTGDIEAALATADTGENPSSPKKVASQEGASNTLLSWGIFIITAVVLLMILSVLIFLATR